MKKRLAKKILKRWYLVPETYSWAQDERARARWRKYRRNYPPYKAWRVMDREARRQWARKRLQDLALRLAEVSIAAAARETGEEIFYFFQKRRWARKSA